MTLLFLRFRVAQFARTPRLRHRHEFLDGNYGESWQAAAARELDEEAGIRIEDPAKITHLRTESTPDGSRVLMFERAPMIARTALPPFVPNNETSERVIVYEPVTLAFPIPRSRSNGSSYKHVA